MSRIPITAPLQGPAVVIGAEARHLVKVLRLKVGDPVTAFDGEGREWQARITRTSESRVELALGAAQAVSRESPLRITLGQAVGKGEKLETVVRAATELGVSAVIPVRTRRAVATAEGPGRRERLERIAVEACKQCGRATVPEVSAPLSLEEFLGRTRECEIKRVAWEEATVPLKTTLPGKASTAALLVGPEGGLAEAEVRQAEGAGFRAVSLGPRILRTETAGPALVAIVQSFLGDLG